MVYWRALGEANAANRQVARAPEDYQPSLKHSSCCQARPGGIAIRRSNPSAPEYSRPGSVTPAPMAPLCSTSMCPTPM